MKLTLSQYLQGTITGYYPGQSNQNRDLSPSEKNRFESQRTAYFCFSDSTSRVEVTATSLVEQPEGVVGVFENKEGQTFVGTWNEEARCFVGMRFPVSKVAGAEVEYQAQVKAYPACATQVKCDSWTDLGLPIFLCAGVPTRHISSSNASIFTWRKIYGGGMGWVQDPD